MAQTSKSRRHQDPNKTRNGAQRILTLGWHQLQESLSKESKPKIRQKLQNRIDWIRKHKPNLVQIQSTETSEQ